MNMFDAVVDAGLGEVWEDCCWLYHDDVEETSFKVVANVEGLDLLQVAMQIHENSVRSAGSCAAKLYEADEVLLVVYLHEACDLHVVPGLLCGLDLPAFTCYNAQISDPSPLWIAHSHQSDSVALPYHLWLDGVVLTS